MQDIQLFRAWALFAFLHGLPTFHSPFFGSTFCSAGFNVWQAFFQVAAVITLWTAPDFHDPYNSVSEDERTSFPVSSGKNPGENSYQPRSCAHL